ncbi:hypothetical protein PT974_03607 [Cladobotryum mycophilum]|uniref:Uncharacterized protein n=1 Tax=Cladobotryum mycophilum TaxID=491253 RepID=A0ABR0ST56_9HYPO
MKFSLFAGAVLATSGMATPLEQRANKMVRFPLPDPQNWIANGNWTDDVTVTITKAQDKYTAPQWEAFVLDYCSNRWNATATLSVLANLEGFPKPIWIGMCYTAGKAINGFFERSDRASNSVVYTMA